MSFNSIRCEVGNQSDLITRGAVSEDFQTIAAIAKNRFSYPTRWWNNPRQTVRYSENFRAFFREDDMRVAVAHVLGHEPVSYIYYQLRANQDLYIEELASSRFSRPVPYIATALVAFVASAAAIKSKPRLITLNIPRSAAIVRADPSRPGRYNDLVSYYTQLGFRQMPGAKGYTSHGLRLSRDGVWMEGEFEEVLRKCRDRIIREPQMGSAHETEKIVP